MGPVYPLGGGASEGLPTTNKAGGFKGLLRRLLTPPTPPSPPPPALSPFRVRLISSVILAFSSAALLRVLNNRAATTKITAPATTLTDIMTITELMVVDVSPSVSESVRGGPDKERASDQGKLGSPHSMHSSVYRTGGFVHVQALSGSW